MYSSSVIETILCFFISVYTVDAYKNYRSTQDGEKWSVLQEADISHMIKNESYHRKDMELVSMNVIPKTNKAFDPLNTYVDGK